MPWRVVCGVCVDSCGFLKTGIISSIYVDAIWWRTTIMNATYPFSPVLNRALRSPVFAHHQTKSGRPLIRSYPHPASTARDQTNIGKKISCDRLHLHSTGMYLTYLIWNYIVRKFFLRSGSVLGKDRGVITLLLSHPHLLSLGNLILEVQMCQTFSSAVQNSSSAKVKRK